MFSVVCWIFTLSLAKAMRSSATLWHVIRGHVAQQGDQDVVVVEHGGIEAGVGGLDGPAEFAPEIELPGKIEASGPGAEKPVRANAGGTRFGGFRANLIARIASRGVLCLREELTDGDTRLSASLQNPFARLARCKILLVGGANQIVEHGVAKDRPPFTRSSSVPLYVRVGGVDPIHGHRRRRGAEAGPDLKAIVDIVRDCRAAAKRHRDGQHAYTTDEQFFRCHVGQPFQADAHVRLESLTYGDRKGVKNRTMWIIGINAHLDEFQIMHFCSLPARCWFLSQLYCLPFGAIPAILYICGSALRRVPVNRYVIAVFITGLMLTASPGCQKQASKGGSNEALAVPVSYPLKRQVTDYLFYTGRTNPVFSVVVPRVTGYLVKMPFKEGSMVKKDDSCSRSIPGRTRHNTQRPKPR